MSKKKISVALSFKNEDAVIEELIKRLRSAFEVSLNGRYDYEIIFVNDDSSDRSLEILEKFAQDDSRIRVLNMSRNFGVFPCSLAGMKAASGDAVIIMDTDLQDPPEVIPEMIEKWESENADVVYTVRTKREGESRVKLFITRLGYLLLKRISSIDMPVESGDFKLMSRRVVDSVLRLEEVEPFLRGLVRWVGYKQVPIYYTREERYAGETHFQIYSPKTIKHYISGITSFSDTPLYMAFAAGLAISAGAFFYLFLVLLMKLLDWNLPGWSAIMVTMLFLGGTQVLAIGILGLYVAKIHMEVKKRPNYIIMDGRNFSSEELDAIQSRRQLS